MSTTRSKTRRRSQITPDAQRRLDLNNEQGETKRRGSVEDEDAPLTKRYLKAFLKGMGIELPSEKQKKESVNTGLSTPNRNNNAELERTIRVPAQNNMADESSTIATSSSSSSAVPVPPAPLEDKNVLPTKPPEIKVGNQGVPTADTFSVWQDEIEGTVNGLSRYRPLLIGEPAKAWEIYQIANAKFSGNPGFLESSFLDAERALWTFIWKGLDLVTRKQVLEDMKNKIEQYNIPRLLNFQGQDPTFYQDSYGLMELLKERFQQKTAWRSAELVEKLNKLKLHDGQDPSFYFAEFNSLEQQLVAACGWRLQNDTNRAISLICSLPNSMKELRPTLLNDPHPTFEGVKGLILRHWHTHNEKGRNFSRPPGHAMASHSSGPARDNHNSNRNNNKGSPNRPRASFFFNKRNKNRSDGPKPAAKGPGQANTASEDHNQQGHRVSLVSIVTNADVDDDSSDRCEMKDVEPSTTIAASSHSPLPSSRTNQVVPLYDHVLLDSGSTNNLTGRRDLMTDVKELNIPLQINTLAGRTSATETGTLPLGNKAQLTKVNFIEQAPYTLMSVAQTCSAGYNVIFTEEGAWVYPNNIRVLNLEHIKKSGNYLLAFDRINNLYVHRLNVQHPHGSSPRRDVNKRVRFSNPIAEPSYGNVTTRAQSKSNSNAKPKGVLKGPDDTIESRPTRLKFEEVKVGPAPAPESLDTSVGGPSPLVQSVLPLSPSITPSVSRDERLPVYQKGLNHYNNAWLWHHRLGHPGQETLGLTNDAHGLGITKAGLNHVFEPGSGCKVCDRCKITRKPIGRKSGKRFNPAQAIMDCWHVDLMGPFTTFSEEEGKRFRSPSIRGDSYVLVMTDEYSRYPMVVPLVAKSNATTALIEKVKLMENLTGLKLKRIHGDGGGEFNNNTLNEFVKSQGIDLTFTTADTPALNGLAESMNKSLTTKARCMMNHFYAPPPLWSLAMSYAAVIHGNSCQPNIQGEIPSARMSQGKGTFYVDPQNFRVFGCDAHVLLKDNQRGKFQQKTKDGIFVGYSRKQNAFKILVCSTLRVEVHRDVRFNEFKFEHLVKVAERIKQEATNALTEVHDETKEWEVDHIAQEVERNGETFYLVFWKGFLEPTWVPQQDLTNCDELLKEFKDRETTRLSKVSMLDTGQEQYSFAAFTFSSTLVNSDSVVEYIEPKSYRQAQRYPDRDKWEEAIEKELGSLDDRHVFTITILPQGRKALDCRWVLTVKRNELNQIIKYKARLVIKGFLQIEGIDYNETFAPTVRYKSIKYLLAIAAQEDLEIKQMDFDTAFLNAELKESIFMKVPEGYNHKVPAGSVLKLNKALYGLKQAPREWYLKLHGSLEKLGYHSSFLDEGLFMKIVDGKRMYLSIYVDDTLAIFPKELQSVWDKDKKAISDEYAIKDLGDCDWILNMAVSRDREKGTITLSQHAYVELLLAEHRMDECKPVRTPFLYHDLTMVPPEVTQIPLTEDEHKVYRSIVGSLLFAANITRIDIAYIVSLLTRFVNAPMNYHLAAARRVLQYLNGTSEKKLVFTASHRDESKSNNTGCPYSLKIYTDSNWAGERGDCKSTGGHVTVINDRPVSWQSKKQSTVAKSSTEAEYYALTEAVSEALFARQWFHHYTGHLLQVEIRCDNTGAKCLADHSTNHNRTKHIDVKHFFVREHVEKGIVHIEYISTIEQLADILTKATTPVIFTRLRERLLL